MTHKYLCDRLYTMDAKDNLKQSADRIEILVTSEVALANYNIDTSSKVPLEKMARYFSY